MPSEFQLLNLKIRAFVINLNNNNTVADEHCEQLLIVLKLFISNNHVWIKHITGTKFLYLSTKG